jgi:hypothetical protein
MAAEIKNNKNKRAEPDGGRLARLACRKYLADGPYGGESWTQILARAGHKSPPSPCPPDSAADNRASCEPAPWKLVSYIPKW